MTKKKHYKQIVGNPTHAGTFILPEGRDIEYIVIDRIEERKGENVAGQKKDGAFAIFKPNPYTNLPMMLNVTNAKTLCFLAKKTPYELLDIKDLPVRLTSEHTRIGEGLRISKIPAKVPQQAPKPPAKPAPAKPAEPAPAPVAAPPKPTPPPVKKEELTTSHKNYPTCVNYVRNGGDINDLEKKYILTDEMRQAILDAIK